jgi:amidase
MTTPTEHTAAEAVSLLSCGTTAVQLTRHYLNRIERINPVCNAVIAIAPDALAAAEASDRRRRDGALLGPLDGVPVLVKDNIQAVGLPGSAGSRALLDSPVLDDAPLVTRLRGAGLVVLGATNLSEWANFRSTASTSGWSAVGGQTRNPHDLDCNTSGSSSGSAAAIAAGLAPLAIGTETDGSIVSPAGTCGVVGFKPTLGTVPGQGIVPISPRQDTAGPIARTVADAAALYAVLSGTAIGAPKVSLAGARVAIWRPADLPPGIAGLLDDVEHRLVQAGCAIFAATLPPCQEPAGPFADAEFEALVAEFAVALPAYLAARPGPHPRSWQQLQAFNRSDPVELSRFSDEIFQLSAAAEAAGGFDNPAYHAARRACDARAASELAAILGDCAFAIAPSNAPAWQIRYGSQEHEHVATSSPCAITGAPSVTLPAGRVGRLPVGISLLGRHNTDHQLLAWAAAVAGLLPEPAFAELP